MGKEVVVRLKGGLGNQLFQYAAAYAVAKRNGAKLMIDSYTGFPIDPVNRKYSLDQYPIEGETLPSEECYKIADESKLERRYRSYREQLRLRVFKTMYDPGVHRLKVRNRVVMEGFWISPRYMGDLAGNIKSQLETPLELSDYALQYREIMQSCNSVSVHLRKLHGLAPDGKQLSWKYRRGIPFVLSAEYYSKALDHIRAQRGKDIHIFVFSDSPARAQAEYNPGGNITFINNPTGRDYEDLYLMNQCRHHVLANSTFSWWGAWLGQAEDQIVCAPDYSSNTSNWPVVEDVYPPSWHILRERPIK